MRKKLISMAIVFAMMVAMIPTIIIPALAATYDGSCGGSVSWTLDTASGTLTISGSGKMEDYTTSSTTPWYEYRKEISHIVINSGVTSIGDHAFMSFSNMKNITIPVSVTTVGKYAFAYCENLTNLTIGSGVVTVGESAVFGCKKLESITIPASVKIINEPQFRNCNSLVTLNVASNNTNFVSVDGVLFNKAQTELLAFPAGKTGSYTIPSGVKKIGYEAFWGSALTTVVMPTSLETIESSAFYVCYDLENADIPSGVTSIGSSAFSGCQSLKSVVIPNNITSIEYNTFSYCYMLTEIIIPNNISKIDGSAFKNCTTLSDVTIGRDVATIGYNVFDGCSSLSEMKFLGNAPTVNAASADNSSFSDDVILRYSDAATGWSTPTWNGYTAYPNNYNPNDPNAFSITLGNTTQTLAVGGTAIIQAITRPSGSAVSWTSSDSSIVSISSQGAKSVITAQRAGKAKITASITVNGETKTASCEVTVPGVSFSSDTIFYSLTNKQCYLIDFQYLSKYPSDAVVIWSSDNTGVAAVLDGSLETKSTGSANVTASITYDGNAYSDTCTVYVYKCSFDQDEVVIPKGNTGTLPEFNYSGLPAGCVVYYESANSNIVTLSGGRTLTAVSEGETAVDAVITYNGVRVATHSCNVIVPAIRITPDSVINLSKGNFAALAANTIPGNCTVTWSSNKTSVARVEQGAGGEGTQKIVAVGPGEATITATITVGDKTLSDSRLVKVAEYSDKDIAGAYAEYANLYVGLTKEQLNGKTPIGNEDSRMVIPLDITASLWCADFVGRTAITFGINEVVDNNGTVANVNGIIPYSRSCASLYKIMTAQDSVYNGIGYYRKNANDPDHCFSSTTIPITNWDWVDEEFSPQPGDIIFIKWWNDTAGDKTTFSHVGLVHSNNGNGSINVVHGNSGNPRQVSYSTYFPNDSAIREFAFVRPNYDVNKIAWTGQVKYYLHCPIDVVFSYNGEELNSATNTFSASFGTMAPDGDGYVVTVDYGLPYDIIVTGTGDGSMDLEVEFDTNHGQNTRTFQNVPITANTTAYVYTNSANSGVEILVNESAGERLWYADAGKTVSSYDKELSESYLNQDKYDEGGNQNNTGNSGGVSASSSVSISSLNNGSVSLSPKNPSKGDKVNLTVTPDEGYELESLTITDKSGNTISYTKNSDGKYTFTMPDSDVTIAAIFVASDWSNPFTDVSSSAWFYGAVKYAYENGIMQGTGNGLFEPNTKLSRAMLVQMLYNLENQPTVGNPTFGDVASGAWYSDAVTWASGNNIVSGYGNGNFGPNDEITREQMAVMLYRYCEYKGIELPNSRTEEAFADAGSISDWAVEAVEAMYAAEILNGKGYGIFDPKGTATRAEVAQMMMNFMEIIK